MKRSYSFLSHDLFPSETAYEIRENVVSDSLAFAPFLVTRGDEKSFDGGDYKATWI